MVEMALETVRASGHRPEYRKFTRGLTGVGYRVVCECGWSARVPEGKSAAVTEHNDHLRRAAIEDPET